jgi:hypothetical protein
MDIPAPPSIGTKPEDKYANTIWTALDKLPNQSKFSGTDPNSVVTGVPGDMVTSVGASNNSQRWWGKVGAARTPSKTSWLPFAMISAVGGLSNNTLSPESGNTINVLSHISLAAKRITNMAEPINPSDAATKNYVDSAVPTSIISPVALSVDYTNATTTGTKVTGLAKTLAAGTYRFEYSLLVQTTTASSGILFGLNFTGTHTVLIAHEIYLGTGTLAATGTIDDAHTSALAQLFEGGGTVTETTTAPDMNVIITFNAANTSYLVRIIGIIVVTVTGDLELWASSEVGTVTATIKANSSLMLTKVA